MAIRDLLIPVKKHRPLAGRFTIGDSAVLHARAAARRALSA